jgi:glyoxylase-like metal-dependent hydrolase (beta-lactamase superfamily II)
VFARQPKTDEELRIAWRARLLCPSASIRTEDKSEPVPDIFPEPMTKDVFRLGYNAAHSAGAHSFLVTARVGNFMIDSPRWTRQVVDHLEQRGGLAGILLTHKDDVADADRYAKHFGARVWIHYDDRSRAPYADQLIKGREPVAIGEGIVAIPLPGHTKGSVGYLYDRRCLFTGDSLAWSFENDDLSAWRDFCWYSWSEQTQSLNRLLDYSFEWVLAGHGGSKGLSAPEMKRRLKALVERMERDDFIA